MCVGSGARPDRSGWHRGATGAARRPRPHRKGTANNTHKLRLATRRPQQLAPVATADEQQPARVISSYPQLNDQSRTSSSGPGQARLPKVSDWCLPCMQQTNTLKQPGPPRPRTEPSRNRRPMQLARRVRKVVGNVGARRWRSPKNNTKEAARIASHDRPDPIRLNKVVSDCCCRRGAVRWWCLRRPATANLIITHARTPTAAN